MNHLMLNVSAKWTRRLIFGLTIMFAAGNASALLITRTFVSEGQAFDVAGVGTSGPSASAGGGNLIDIFNVAANWWEAAILDSFTVNIQFGWGSGLGFSTLGVHNLTAQGGTPHRETAGQIRFNNSFNWFMDATPLDHSEYGSFTETALNLGGAEGDMNIGRVYADALGDAVGRYDLFTVALHEIGHALGLSSANTAFQTVVVDPGSPSYRELTLTAPRAHAGAVIPIERGSAHIGEEESLMWPFIDSGMRSMLSDADILANCEISQFRQCVLNPQLSVPEPGTLMLFLTALGVGTIVRRRKVAAE